MKRGKRISLILAALACMGSLLVMMVILTGGQTAEFTPPPFEPAAQTGTPLVPAELGWSEVDAQAFRAFLCGQIVPSGDTAEIWLTNPESNTVWLKLRMLDERGNVLGETGLLRPGEFVRSVRLDPVPKAGVAVTLKLMAYQPDTYYSEGSVSLRTVIAE